MPAHRAFCRFLNYWVFQPIVPMSSLPLPPLPGVEALSVLTEGRYSMLLCGRSTATGRDVVVKTLPREDPTMRESMTPVVREERLLLGMVRSPHIVPVLEAGESAEYGPYFLMPRLPGLSLKKRMIQRDQAVSLHWPRILRGLAEALHTLRSVPIVHRDVKPENVLLNEEHAPVLIDFSLAVKGVRRPRTIAGSATYMAPEQVRREPLTPATDVYAFAVLAFELLAGRPPFVGKSKPAILDQHLLTEAPSVRRYAAWVGEDLADWVAAGLSKDPSQRPTDAREIGEFLPVDTDVPMLPWMLGGTGRPGEPQV